MQQRWMPMLVALLPAQPDAAERVAKASRCARVRARSFPRSLARSFAPSPLPSPSPLLPPSRALPRALPRALARAAPAPAPPPAAASVYTVYMLPQVFSFLHFKKNITLLGELYSGLQYCWMHLKTICTDPFRWGPVGLGPPNPTAVGCAGKSGWIFGAPFFPQAGCL